MLGKLLCIRKLIRANVGLLYVCACGHVFQHVSQGLCSKPMAFNPLGSKAVKSERGWTLLQGHG